MTRYYRKKKMGRGENLRAGLLAGSLATIVGGASYYLVRIFLSREALEPVEMAPQPDRSAEPRAEHED